MLYFPPYTQTHWLVSINVYLSLGRKNAGANEIKGMQVNEIDGSKDSHIRQ